MKWLFATLVALNIVVFAGMLGYKMFSKHFPQQAQVAPVTAPTQAPPQVIINTGGGTAVPNATTTAGGSGNTNVTTRATAPRTIGNGTSPKIAPKPKTETTPSESARAQYRACSARVSMPEDDYHRIKGLLSRFPHAATRQVVENTGEEGGQTTSRMNVLFMSVNDQEASALQGIVGRYGQLNRAACNK
ncbi:cell division protein [Neisseriaceae bacterium B1]